MMWVPNCVPGPVVSSKQQGPDEHSSPQHAATVEHSLSLSHHGNGVLSDAVFGQGKSTQHLEVEGLTGEDQGLEKEGEGLGATEVEQYFIGNTAKGGFEDNDHQDGSNVGDEDGRYEPEYQMSVEVEDYEGGEQDPKPQYLEEGGNLKRKYSEITVIGNDEGAEVSLKTPRLILV